MDFVTIEDCVKFHGHFCGGIAIGYVMSKFAMEQIGAKPGDPLYCRAEFQNCMTDGVQMVTGCTAGKGNLELYPIGKRALTLVHKATGEGVRVVADITFPEGMSKEDMIDMVLTTDPATYCKATPAKLEVPKKVKGGFVYCDICKEEFGAEHAVTIDGKVCCPDCAAKLR